ncbi:hypothetical protein ACGFZK_00040 [Streptomyces sp. NPDC048257]|uniref:hypothetical protein n=1 Tax=Streptomyces sp. NPDC048257 TaxID=3365526 RepID=UPI00372236A1
MNAPPPWHAPVAWHDVDSPAFPYAARADGRWLILRLNDFPEHPLYTLFVDARAVADMDDVPVAWRLPPRVPLPALTAPERVEVLRLMAGLGPYGAEARTPCEGDYCTCTVLTDAYAATSASPAAPRDADGPVQ